MFNVGDIVRFENNGDSIVGIIYENGNKVAGDFRVKAVGIVKYRQLDENQLTPATEQELSFHNQEITFPLLPSAIIAEETAEAGGILPQQKPPIPEEKTIIEEE